MDAYSRRRRENRLILQQRRDEIYEEIPEIRRIDEEIAHISLNKTRYMLMHPEEDKREELHREIYALSMEKVNLLAQHGYPADYLDDIYHCPTCRDTGYIGDRRCSCFAAYASDILYDQSNLREVAGNNDFSAFRLDYYSDQKTDKHPLSPRENIRQILTRTEDFIRRFDEKPGQNILICGHAGVGKTFLSTCIAARLLKMGKSVIYLTSYQFFHHLEKSTFRRDAGEGDISGDLLQCDLLIIDDLGTEMNNSFTNSRLFLCINERMLKKKSTIINTNLSLKQINRIYSERVSSRIIESYLIFHIYGDDIRVKKAFSGSDS